MRSYEATATIAAEPDDIWAVLVDGAGYTQWDSGVSSVDGQIAPGGRITVVSEAAPGRAFPVKVTEFDPGRRMTWSGGMPLGLFKGVRTFTLTRRAQAPPRSGSGRSTAARCCRSSGARCPISGRRSRASRPA